MKPISIRKVKARFQRHADKMAMLGQVKINAIAAQQRAEIRAGEAEAKLIAMRGLFDAREKSMSLEIKKLQIANASLLERLLDWKGRK